MTEAEARFNDSITKRADLKERGFEIDSPYLQFIEAVITMRVWQEFCKPPKAVSMTVVREFYANAKEAMRSVAMVKEKQIQYDGVSNNKLLNI